MTNRLSRALAFSCFATTLMEGCGDEDDPQDDDGSSSSVTASSGSDGPDDGGSTDGTTDVDAETSSADGTEGATTGECQGVVPGACGDCLAQDCCAEISACADVPGCIGCVGGDLDACTEQAAHDAADALLMCGAPDCDAACLGLPAPHCMPDMASPSAGSCVVLRGTFECNPITQEPCDVASGAACDVNEALDGFSCYPDSNTNALCETCSVRDGFCQPGLGCPAAQMDLGNFGQCSKFCCEDGDCGPDGTCYLDFFATLGLPVGYCVPP